MSVPLPTVFQTGMVVPNKLLMGPGPSNYPERVRQAMANPVLGQLHGETFKIMDDIKEGIKYLFQTNNPLTLCLSASGHAGLESGLCNLIEDGDVVLIAVQGIWGERAAEMAKRLGGDVRLIVKEPGQQVTLEEAREQFAKHKPSLFFIAHGESSTGMMQSLDGFGDLCREFECIFLVDSVITLGCTPFYVDKWKIDVAYTGSQKVLNAPPGITPITFNSRALAKIKSRKTLVKSYNFDIQYLGEYWNCFPDRKRIYHHTICSTLLYGLREAIAMFVEQGGLEVSWKKHSRVATNLYKSFESRGFQMFIDDPKHRVPSVTSIQVPKGVDALKVASYAMQKYKVEIGGGLGPTVGQIFRIGLMGHNATDELVEKTLRIILEAIEASKNEKISSKL